MRGVAQSPGKDARSAPATTEVAARRAGKAGTSRTVRILGERLPNPPTPSGTAQARLMQGKGSLERHHPRIPKDPSDRHP